MGEGTILFGIICEVFIYLCDMRMLCLFACKKDPLPTPTINLIYNFIVVFTNLGSRDFHDLFNHYIFSFHKRYVYCKTGALDICVTFFQIFCATFS